MRKIESDNLAQLLMELRFAPQSQRRKQLDAAEELLSIIAPDKEYPFEFIVFKITGYRPKKSLESETLIGNELAEDLRIFISKLSAQIAPPAGEQKEKIYTIEQLAEASGVSTKTISRWRKKGLIARKFVFEEGKKRFGFLQSTVDKFFDQNPQLTNRAKNFDRLTAKEKKTIIKQVASLAAGKQLSRYQIIEQIAKKRGKAHETIRYTIINYEKANPDKEIFDEPPGVISPEDAAELYKLFRQGCDIKELIKRFRRSKSSIYRIVNQKRARALLAQKIEFIQSDEFLHDDAEEKILEEPIENLIPPSLKSIEPLTNASGSLPQYLKALKSSPLLNRQREAQLFRRYNYLKYLACINRAVLKLGQTPSELLDKIEKYLSEAETIKKIIIEANLRLVVSIANKHTASGDNLLDLISEGNFSMMRALEKFDYSRGFRFATYASWAIAKDYARKIPAESARPDKAAPASMDNIQRDLRTVTSASVVNVERARHSLVQVIRDELDEREQYIIIHHFGLTGSLIRKNKKTLQQIGRDLDLTKERVRQIELGALQKLKRSLSIEEFDLLMG